MAGASDGAKIGLSLVGAVLLILLCLELAMAPGRTSGNIIFATVFLVLLIYSITRFFRRK